MLNLQDKKVVITGGSSGMGLATARLAAEAGAKVILIARRQEMLERAAEQIGSQPQTYSLDVSDEAAVSACFQEIGSFDHLVTAAAGNVVGTVADTDYQTAVDFFKVKLWGQYVCARAATPHLSSEGSITLFSGAGSRRVFPGFAIVGTSEAAIEQLTKYLAHEFAPVRVNAVVPGVIETPLTKAIPNWEAVREATAQVLPCNRVGEAEDVAEAVLMLMNNEFMSGSIVDVDGGHSVV